MKSNHSVQTNTGRHGVDSWVEAVWRATLKEPGPVPRVLGGNRRSHISNREHDSLQTRNGLKGRLKSTNWRCLFLLLGFSVYECVTASPRGSRVRSRSEIPGEVSPCRKDPGESCPLAGRAESRVGMKWHSCWSFHALTLGDNYMLNLWLFVPPMDDVTLSVHWADRSDRVTTAS